MLKIGRIKDIDREEDIPNDIKKSVIDDLEALDYYYGIDRDVDKDMGGFVVICSKNEPLNIPDFDVTTDVAEYSEKVGNYEKSLYISGSERNIIIYRKLN